MADPRKHENPAEQRASHEPKHMLGFWRHGISLRHSGDLNADGRCFRPRPRRLPLMVNQNVAGMVNSQGPGCQGDWRASTCDPGESDDRHTAAYAARGPAAAPNSP